MKRLFSFIAVFVAASSFFISSVHAQSVLPEEIASFHSDITINKNTSVSITETIDYTTTLQKHGIYRYIPVTYGAGGREKETHRISHISVKDERGRTIPFTRSQDGLNLNLKIGDADVTFTGDKTYIISYEVEQALDHYDDHVEFYWDITGEGWKVPIASSSATVTSPFSPIERVTCYSGLVGRDDGGCTSSFIERSASFVYPQEVAYGENFTIVVGLPKESQLVFPTQQELLRSWIEDNWVLFLLPLPTLLVILVWIKKGRDIQFVSPDVFNLDPNRPVQRRPLSFKAREPFVYEPLKMLTPGEAGSLIDGQASPRDVVAEILELARKKYLKIDRVESKVLFFSVKDYTFTKLKPMTSPEPAAQTYLFGQLFKIQDVVSLSSLKGTFYQEMAAVRAMLKSSLEQKGIYETKPSVTKAWALGVNFASSAAVFGLVSVYLLPLDIVWPVIVLFVQFGLLSLWGGLLAQKSAVGTNLWLQTRGLRKTITYGKWREEIKEKNLFIEEVLPFAVAFGVVDKLASDMDKLGVNPPDYLGSANLGGLTAAQFVNDFSTTVGQNLSYNPSSSSRSGGSGFSGGSSGGGGGGGGGGSW
ncbi:MAG: DUF2207 domain-containing protein [Candidatus Pacebacteria bacterium]|nr:DUF2207 domain-containing protein [Candidatus Paceibacterota bacterium]PIR63745.1 MAG: hypothetical protein COU64_02105 [Candidatus Pacebacteria bacterium CG10_big_fil_rev_8_21_14_0_10_40_26]PIZ78531.1 MAG: hypothetical protein COY01_04790 [Candidatus Pacebacteria bacterium CG_4_10_14_0_2_um_filter_40_20]PJA69382.1 MAG: hypothetical protein CO156_00680 [Candidatus Pacebacteria bacterium CG_4_9_14_3_um_filter_40_12]PJC41399.1 MAG: hypothetical protein CO041_04665 [Candidatus Pacebacteria bact